MHSEHPRIDELISGKRFDHCFRILTEIEKIDGAPARYVSKHLPKWAEAGYNLAMHCLPFGKTQFVDIETRGLAKKDQIWLIGSAHINSKGLVVEQFLARDPLEEGSILRAFYSVTGQRPYWVSFNGETFDESRLNARAQAHLLPPAKCQRHVDVFDIYRSDARKRRLKSVTLRELERVIFPSFQRTNHIEGRDIPAAYQHYIDGGDPNPVKNAIDHNTYDLVTLAALYLKKLQEAP